MAKLNAFTQLMTGDFSSGINKVIKSIDKATDKLLKASGATDKFNKNLDATGASANKVIGGLGKFINITDMIANTVKGMNIADEYINTAARLDLINDGLQTHAELQDKIFAAANRSRSVYSEMAGAVSEMGLVAGDAFTSNDELIAFTELIQKSLKVGGADTSEQQGVMEQLSQSMASGGLQDDELVSIMKDAPMVYDAISKYMGLSKEELKKLSSEGVITSDIIKNAMFFAAGDINKAFNEMPMTFGDMWNRIKNEALKAFGPVIEKVNELINTDDFQTFVNNVIRGFNLATEAASWLIDAIVNGWDTIGPILVIIGGVLLVTIIGKLWAMVPPLIAQAAAWLSIYWPILLVIAIIGVAIAAARQLGASWDEIIGFIGGTIGVFATYFYNEFVKMWNAAAAFINFFGNAFTNPIASIKALFLDLAVSAIGFIEKIAQGIEGLLNMIPGIDVNIVGGLTNIKDSLAAKSAEIKTEADLKTFVQSKEFIDYSEGFEKGSKGKDLVDKISNIFDMSGLINDKGYDLSQFVSSQKPLNVQGEVKVKMSDEDLGHLRDIAEREYINKFSTATLAPNISFTFGDIRETADVNEIKGTLEMMMREEIAVAAEGSY